MRAQRVAVAALAATAVSMALATPSHAAAVSRPARVRVPNIQPALSGARRTGATPAAQKVNVRLYLAARDTAGLAARVRAVSDPRSSSYGHYLTAAQFRAAYAPDAATVAAVRSFLTGYGLKVAGVPANHAYVDATGTAAQAEKAFGASLSQYTKGGATLRGTTAATTVPSSLAGKVLAVTGLSTRTSRVKPNSVGGPSTKHRARPARTTGKAAPPPDAFVNAPPCSTYYGEKIATTVPPAFGKQQPYVPCGYVPSQFQSAYGLTSSIKKGFDGRGVTVAITDAYASPTILSDANTYATRHGQAPFRKGQFKQVLPSSFTNGYDSPPTDGYPQDVCGEQGWYGEETLDVEAVHAMAPGANVTYVAGSSCLDDDLITALVKVIDGHLANIVTNSWGGIDEGSPELQDVYQQVFYQGALEGIGFYFSSGDNGDGSTIPDNKGTAYVESPANSTLATAVGGTSLAIGAKGQRLWETGWSTGRSVLTNGAWTPPPPGTFQYGAGGGTSRDYAQPWYQQGVVPDRLAKRYSDQPGRVVPDVAMDGDPNTGMLIGITQTFPDKTVKYSEYRLGGTSLASPLFAGVMAIADQVAGRPHGFANPALYALYGTKAYYDPTARQGEAVVRNDYVNSVDASKGITTSLRSIDAELGILHATKGYDDITGVGTPTGPAFLGGLPVAR